jgi:heterokaryon incompatibility protein (HET)
MTLACDRCLAIDLQLLLNSFYRPDDLALGTVAEILARETSCTLCEFIAQVLRSEPDAIRLMTELKATEVQVTFNSLYGRYLNACGHTSTHIEFVQDSVFTNQLRFPGCEKRYARVRLGSSAANSRQLIDFAQLYDPATPHNEQQLNERRIDPIKVDVTLIQSWLKTCLDNHGQVCSNPAWLRVKPVTALRVVDVQSWSVIMAPEHLEFAALSYMWGGPHFVATLRDLQHLPWKLPQPPVLGQTLADAMWLCAELGVRYIWIDALCIAQIPEQNEDKNFHLNQMDRIYRSAIITICAASSPSASSGISELSQRKVQQQIFNFKGNSYACLGPEVPNEIDSQPWNWRGWTYQERVLSRRSIIITPSQAFWTCQCDTWTERTTSEPMHSEVAGLLQRPLCEVKKPDGRVYGLQAEAEAYLPGCPLPIAHDEFMSTYDRVVTMYTVRQLSTPLDGLNAITGILNVLNEALEFEGNVFLFGLPTVEFDIAISWKPRYAADRSLIMTEKRTIPSWAWASWFNESWFGVYWDPHTSLSYSSIKPAIIWYVLQSNGSSLALPVNTTRERGEVCGLTALETLLDPPQISAELVQVGNFYLHFLTTTASFVLGSKLRWEESFSDMSELPGHIKLVLERLTPTNPYELLDEHGSLVGHIEISETEALELSGKNMDFVFISYHSAFDWVVKSTELEGLIRETREKPISPYKGWPIVNCMMIQYDKYTGFAERRKIAKVLRRAWLAARPKSKWIVLG